MSHAEDDPAGGAAGSPRPSSGAAPSDAPAQASPGATPADGSSDTATGPAPDDDGPDEDGPDDDGPGEPDHDEPVLLLHVLRERAIDLRSMEWPLRLSTGLAVAQLLAAAILVLVGSLPLPAISLGTIEAGQNVAMPQAVFWATVLFLATSWSYLLSGALHAKGVIRLAGLAIFTLAMLPLVISAWVPSRLFGGLWGVLAVAALLAIWLLALAAWRFDVRVTRAGQHYRHHHVRFDPLLFAVVLLLTLALYGFSYASVRNVGSLLFTGNIYLQIAGFVLFIAPMLFLSGSDFADWGLLIGERIALAAQPRRPPVFLAGVTALLAAAILVTSLRAHGKEILLALGPAAFFAALLVLLARLIRLGPQWPAQVAYPVLPLCAVGFFLLQLLGSVVSVLGTPRPAGSPEQQVLGRQMTTFSHVTTPVFSVTYPALWEVRRERDTGPNAAVAIAFVGDTAADPATFHVVALPRAEVATPDDALADWLARCCGQQPAADGPISQQGQWRQSSFRLMPTVGAGRRGLAWQFTDEDRVWLLYGDTPPELASSYRPLFVAMTASWKPTVEASSADVAQGEATSGSNLGVTVMSGGWLLAALAAATLLVRRLRRGRFDGRSAAYLFMLVSGLFFILANVDSVAQALLGISADRIPHLRLPALQALVAVGTLGVLGWLGVTHRLSARVTPALVGLCVGNVGLQAVSSFTDLYDQTTALSEHFIAAQALLIVLAGLWDVSMSGGEITNVHGDTFPRHTRVFLFFGYVMLVATAVLFASSLRVQATGAAVTSFFDSDQLVQFGLLVFGTPLILTTVALRLGRSLRR